MEKLQTAQLNYLKIAPRKVRLVANSIKGLTVSEAEARLFLNSKRAAQPIIKLLRSAVSNAKNTQKLDVNKLVVKEIRVDEGPVVKRFMPRAMGRATPINKRSSHIMLILEESEIAKEPRFNIKRREKVSKSSRAAKAEKDQKEKDKEVVRQKTESSVKTGSDQGFMKKMFRRKAV